MKRRPGKRDLLLIMALLLVCAVSAVAVYFLQSKNGAYAVVTIDGSEYGRYDLSKEQTIEIRKDGVVTNTLQIIDGHADMTDADCPDKLCVHQKAISKSTESIICLPNKVVVTIEGGSEGNFDSMAR